MSSWRQFCTVLCVAVFSLSAGAAFAQGSGAGKPPEKKPAENAKEGQKKIDEIAEAARVINGTCRQPGMRLAGPPRGQSAVA